MKDKEDKLKETLVISSSLFYKKIQNISYLGKRASEVCEELTKFSEGIENIIKSIEGGRNWGHKFTKCKTKIE